MKTIPAWLQSKLAALSEHRDEVAQHARQPIIKADHTRALIGSMRAELASMTASGGEPDPATLAEIARLEAETEAAVAEHVRRRERAIDADQAYTSAKDFLATLRDVTRLERAPLIKIGNGDGQRLLSLTRRDISELHEQLRVLRSRPVERAEIAEQIGQEVTRLARRGLRYHPGHGGLSELHPVSLLGTLAAIFPGELVAGLTDGYVREQERALPGLDPIGSAERAEAIAVIDGRLSDLERQEEALVEKLISDNPFGTSRRRDAAPAAILGVVVVGNIVKQKPPPTEPSESELVVEAAE